jgi:predicted SAM-dependent methyltransferase
LIAVTSRLSRTLRYFSNRLIAKAQQPTQLGRDMQVGRELIAEAYLKGEGIEIGALHDPLKVPGSATVKYVDRLSVPDLRKQYPELDSKSLVEVDIIANGELLESIGDATQDFVIANHFIEHCQDPIRALLNMFRVLKVGGKIYMAVPDKRYSFDLDRPITPLEHLFRDYKEGPEWSKRQHFEEWVRFVNKVEGDEEVKSQIDVNMEMDYSIHFHVWTQWEMLEFVAAMRNMVTFDIELVLRNVNEVVFVFRKDAPAPAG